MATDVETLVEDEELGGVETPATSLTEEEIAARNRLVDTILKSEGLAQDEEEEEEVEEASALEEAVDRFELRGSIAVAVLMCVAMVVVWFGLHIPVYYEANMELIEAQHGETTSVEVLIDGEWRMLPMVDAIALALFGEEALESVEVKAIIQNDIVNEDPAEVKALTHAALANAGWTARTPQPETAWTAAEAAGAAQVQAIIMETLKLLALGVVAVGMAHSSYRRVKFPLVATVASVLFGIHFWSIFTRVADGVQPVFGIGYAPHYVIPGPGTTAVSVGLAGFAALGLVAAVWTAYVIRQRIKNSQIRRTVKAFQNWINSRVESWTEDEKPDDAKAKA